MASASVDPKTRNSTAIVLVVALVDLSSNNCLLLLLSVGGGDGGGDGGGLGGGGDGGGDGGGFGGGLGGGDGGGLGGGGARTSTTSTISTAAGTFAPPEAFLKNAIIPLRNKADTAFTSNSSLL